MRVNGICECDEKQKIKWIRNSKWVGKLVSK